MKALFYGVGAAAIAGLMTGGAMKPQLRTADGPVGPQIVAPVSGDRAPQGPYANLPTPNFHGSPPDYVIGTDWIEPTLDPSPRLERRVVDSVERSRRPALPEANRKSEPPRSSWSAKTASEILARVRPIPIEAAGDQAPA